MLLGWVDCTRAQRVVKFMTLSQMKEFHKSHGGLPTITWSGKVDIVRERLAGALDAAENEDGVHCHDYQDEEISTGEHAPITELARSSFMKPLRKGRDEG